MCEEDSEVTVKSDSSYVNLAIAIINQAKRDIARSEGRWKEDAKVFLQSDWYETLQYMIDLYKNPEGNTI